MKTMSAALCLAAALWTPMPVVAKDIVVAQTLDLSGLSNLGKDFSNGIRTYFDAVNARGGVRGRRIQFVQLDDSGRAADAAANVDKLLLENEVDALIAPTSEETLLAAATSPRVRASGLTMIGAPTGTDIDRAGLAARVLAVRATYRDEARVLLDYLKTFSEGGVALVRGDGPDAEACVQAMREEARARGLTLAFDGSSQRWLSRTVGRPAIGAVIVAGDALGVTPALLHARKISPLVALLGFSTVDHRTLIEIAGAAAKGMMITQAVPPPGKTIHTFQREHRALMKQYRDEPPSQHTLEGFVVARLLVSALERVDGEPTAAKVTTALRAAPALDFGPMRVGGRGAGAGARYVDITAISSKGGLVE
jgi:ABC-type branched-subunit amino acid transport system substrate-binding protein